MVSSETTITAIGILGNGISLFLFLSPAPTFVRIWKRKSVEQYSAAPYLATLMNCMTWLLYGMPMVHPNSTLVITINASGCVIVIVFLILFLAFCHPQSRITLLLSLLLELVFIIVLSLLILNLAHSYDLRSTIVGAICVFCSAVMYASPLSVMKVVVQTRSVEFMPFFVSLASFLNSVVWASYALLRLDPFIIIPNGLGIIFSAAQLILYGIYYKSTDVATSTNIGELGMVEASTL